MTDSLKSPRRLESTFCVRPHFEESKTLYKYSKFRVSIFRIREIQSENLRIKLHEDIYGDNITFFLDLILESNYEKRKGTL